MSPKERALSPWVRVLAWIVGPGALIVAAVMSFQIITSQIELAWWSVSTVILEGGFGAIVAWAAKTGRVPPWFPFNVAHDDEVAIEVRRRSG
jgi:hypothetical protein